MQQLLGLVLRAVGAQAALLLIADGGRWSLEQRCIGSAHVEKANDLLAARRQKVGGRQWSLLTGDSLAALRSLTLNRAWDAYWQHGQVVPLDAY